MLAINNQAAATSVESAQAADSTAESAHGTADMRISDFWEHKYLPYYTEPLPAKDAVLRWTILAAS